MAAQPFERLLEGDPSLLRRVERVLVDAHRRWSESRGRRDWSEPQAYQWLRYEDPDPVARLAEGVRRLGHEVEIPPDALSPALQTASDLGYTERE